jgi:hypothetical protein
LIQSVEGGKIPRRDRILLNITGGGTARVNEDFGLVSLEQDIGYRPGDDTIDLTGELRETLGLKA